MPSKSKPFYVNGVTMSHNTLPTVAELSGEMRERLAKVKYVFTDLDATMLAPGSCVLRDNDDNPSTKLVEPSWRSLALAFRCSHLGPQPYHDPRGRARARPQLLHW